MNRGIDPLSRPVNGFVPRIAIFSAAPSPAADGPPAWARRMKRSQTLSHSVTAAAHAVRSGDSHGGGSSVNLSESD